MEAPIEAVLVLLYAVMTPTLTHYQIPTIIE
jgi:hypothetical protein